MGLFGRRDDEAGAADSWTPAAASPAQEGEDLTEDELQRYRHLLATGLPQTIEELHTEAFAKLAPEERGLLFERLAAGAPDATARPTDASPEALAIAATRTEILRPGTLQRILAGDGGSSSGGSRGGSLLTAVAGYVVASAVLGEIWPHPELGYGWYTGGGTDAGL